jgi:hypothetical protein
LHDCSDEREDGPEHRGCGLQRVPTRDQVGIDYQEAVPLQDYDKILTAMMRGAENKRRANRESSIN